MSPAHAPRHRQSHDCWGWQRTNAGTDGSEPLYGKKWGLQVHGMERGHYAFEQGGWKIVVLDSVQERGDEGHLPVIDEAQYEWFEGKLASTPATTPAMVASHVPILGVGPFYFYDGIVEKYQFKVAGALMHQDTWRLKDLLYGHGNVKLCLSGHVHLKDRVDYNGITYLCNGSVSGSWWHGTHKETPPGYGIARLYADGSFNREYVEYPWDAEA